MAPGFNEKFVVKQVRMSIFRFKNDARGDVFTLTVSFDLFFIR